MSKLLEKMNIKTLEIEDIIEIVKNKYCQLYDRYGIKPNRILISRDVYLKLMLKSELLINTVNAEKSIRLLGINVIIIEGKENFIEAAILYEEQDV